MLDLICGLFGLLVVLYAITARVDGSPGVVSTKLNFVSAEVENLEPITIGLELIVGNQVLRSWPNCGDVGPVNWGPCTHGRTEGLVRSDNTLYRVGIALFNRRGEDMIGPGPMTVMVTTRKHTFKCTLTLRNGFRAQLDPNAAGGSSTCRAV